MLNNDHNVNIEMFILLCINIGVHIANKNFEYYYELQQTNNQNLVLMFLLLFCSPEGSENNETKISELGK